MQRRQERFMNQKTTVRWVSTVLILAVAVVVPDRDASAAVDQVSNWNMTAVQATVAAGVFT